MLNSRAVSFALAALVALSLAPRPSRADEHASLSAADQVKAMQRGVNIVGYDPLWRDASKARFRPRHFKLIKDAGFSSVRMVLQSFQFMNDKYQLPESWFATLDGLVEE